MRKNLVNKQQLVHMHTYFPCICKYWQGKFWRMAHDSPNPPIFPAKNFPCTVHNHCIYLNRERRNHLTNSGSSQDDKINNDSNEEMEIGDIILNYDFALREVISNELNNGMLSCQVKSLVLLHV